VLQCVAVICSAVCFSAVCCSALQCQHNFTCQLAEPLELTQCIDEQFVVAVKSSMLQYVAVCCSVLQVNMLQCMCCSVLQCQHNFVSQLGEPLELTQCVHELFVVAVCCSVSQCVAVQCVSVQCVAVRCNVSTIV